MAQAALRVELDRTHWAESNLNCPTLDNRTQAITRDVRCALGLTVPSIKERDILSIVKNSVFGASDLDVERIVEGLTNKDAGSPIHEGKFLLLVGQLYGRRVADYSGVS